MESLKYKIFFNKARALLAAIILTQCQNLKEVTGIKKTAPDAWSVQLLKGLEIPPGFQDVPSDHPVTENAIPLSAHTDKRKNSPDQAEQSLLENVQPFLKK
ncbi:hypothetical protein P618_200104 [Holospora obtusa F1]|uniref:Uncharacterized protein n=1 Tax=Holospora obtusa F1 TaxID=1399147 RepID=W6TI59_HOLOB|nr:hypothetical protein [Holospora obtusa]ETZ07695.1 hypothetical protein P618_200104 [Holospora obtusa F1]